MSERDREYYRRNKEKIREKNRRYYKENREYYLAYRSKKYHANPEAHRQRERDRYANWRMQVLDAYGSRCACCGETEPLFLEIDHIENDGFRHREKIGRSGKAILKWLVDHKFPKGFQVLCANCNQGKKRNSGICPHKLKKGR